jgi:putative tryptophan/tyrosine transport system substrate-binding protein
MMPPREEPSMERRGTRLSRRQFVGGAGLTGIGLAAGCGRLPWQTPAPVPRIGYLAVTSPAGPAFVDAFRQGLRELGYVEGQNIIVEYRDGEWSDERLSELVTELVRLPVDVIVTLAVP